MNQKTGKIRNKDIWCQGCKALLTSAVCHRATECVTLVQYAGWRRCHALQRPLGSRWINLADWVNGAMWKWASLWIHLEFYVNSTAAYSVWFEEPTNHSWVWWRDSLLLFVCVQLCRWEELIKGIPAMRVSKGDELHLLGGTDCPRRPSTTQGQTEKLDSECLVELLLYLFISISVCHSGGWMCGLVWSRGYCLVLRRLSWVWCVYHLRTVPITFWFIY